MLDSETARDLIRPRMPVVCADDVELATVDHVDGHGMIELAGDGETHFIPLSWVTSIDDRVHIDRTSDVAVREWSTTPTSA
jgi:hypothetical protein